MISRRSPARRGAAAAAAAAAAAWATVKAASVSTADARSSAAPSPPSPPSSAASAGNATLRRSANSSSVGRNAPSTAGGAAVRSFRDAASSAFSFGSWIDVRDSSLGSDSSSNAGSPPLFFEEKDGSPPRFFGDRGSSCARIVAAAAPMPLHPLDETRAVGQPSLGSRVWAQINCTIDETCTSTAVYMYTHSFNCSLGSTESSFSNSDIDCFQVKANLSLKILMLAQLVSLGYFSLLCSGQARYI